MSKKCRAFSASKLGKPDSKATLREAFYAGWEAALAEPEPRNQCAETCERAKLCAICAREIDGAEPERVPESWGEMLLMCNERKAKKSEPANIGCLGMPVNVPVTAPQPAKREPLTDEEIKAFAMEAFDAKWDADDETLVNKYGHGVYLSRFIDFARAIERAHGIGEQE